MSWDTNVQVGCSNVYFSSFKEGQLPEVVSHFDDTDFKNEDKQPVVAGMAKATKRSSKLSKKVLNHVFSRPEAGQCDYSIFVSRFGELSLIERNNEDNADAEELSPSNFAYSVHNAIACLHSIISDEKKPSTSLCVSSNMITTALFEGQAYLACNPDCKNVLVVVYDGYVPERYLGQCADAPKDFVLSFTLERQKHQSKLTDLLSDVSKTRSFSDELTLLKNLLN